MTTTTTIPGHALLLTEGARAYHNNDAKQLPLLTGTCECGGWTREFHRYDAISDEYRAQLAADHKVHATRLTTDIARWPSDANGLHPLLGARWHGDLTEGSEYRKRRVPLEAGGLAKDTTYLQLVEAISEEIQAALEESEDHQGAVPLHAAPRLAAAKALLQQLDRNFPKVEAWCVQVKRGNDTPERAWTYLACHTREEAEAYVPRVVGYLNRDYRNRPGDPSRFAAEVVFQPTDLYRLRLPGMTPETDWFG